jgi:hypothetical protein
VKLAQEANNDSRLSLAARGLLGVLLGKPDTWRIDPVQIAREQATGIVQTRRLMAELVQAGYLIPPQRVRAGGGRFTYTNYLLRELPSLVVTEAAAGAATVTRKPEDGAPATVAGETVEKPTGAETAGAQQESRIRIESLSTDRVETTITERPAVVVAEDLDGQDKIRVTVREEPAFEVVAVDMVGDGPLPPDAAAPPPPPAAVGGRLLEAGVHPDSVARLLQQYSTDEIEQAMAYAKSNAKENIAGYLVKALEKGWHRLRGKGPQPVMAGAGQYVPGQYDAYFIT